MEDITKKMIKLFMSQNKMGEGSLEVGLHFLGPNYINATFNNEYIEQTTQLLFGVL